MLKCLKEEMFYIVHFGLSYCFFYFLYILPFYHFRILSFFPQSLYINLFPSISYQSFPSIFSLQSLYINLFPSIYLNLSDQKQKYQHPVFTQFFPQILQCLSHLVFYCFYGNLKLFSNLFILEPHFTT